MVKYNRNALYLVLGIFTVLLLTACSGKGGSTVDKNRRLNQRLESYITARKNSNLGKLQQLYLKPEQARIGKIIVKECKIVAVVIKDDNLHAETKIENKIQAMGFTFAKVPMTINWIWSNDDWYVEPSVSSGNPFVKKESNPRTSPDTSLKGQNKK